MEFPRVIYLKDKYHPKRVHNLEELNDALKEGYKEPKDFRKWPTDAGTKEPPPVVPKKPEPIKSKPIVKPLVTKTPQEFERKFPGKKAMRAGKMTKAFKEWSR